MVELTQAERELIVKRAQRDLANGDEISDRVADLYAERNFKILNTKRGERGWRLTGSGNEGYFASIDDIYDVLEISNVLPSEVNFDDFKSFKAKYQLMQGALAHANTNGYKRDIRETEPADPEKGIEAVNKRYFRSELSPTLKMTLDEAVQTVQSARRKRDSILKQDDVKDALYRIDNLKNATIEDKAITMLRAGTKIVAGINEYFDKRSKDQITELDQKVGLALAIVASDTRIYNGNLLTPQESYSTGELRAAARLFGTHLPSE